VCLLMVQGTQVSEISELCISLISNPQTMHDARLCIDAADGFAPNDSKIEEERMAIEQWVTRIQG
jgi:hypothetical protein